jgi:alkylation response protein AidB-like acyl-CoA dehydrogenase
MGFLPKDYGGDGVSNVDLQLVAEEITAVDPGFATILLVNGLGLAAGLVRLGGTEAPMDR